MSKIGAWPDLVSAPNFFFLLLFIFSLLLSRVIYSFIAELSFGTQVVHQY